MRVNYNNITCSFVSPCHVEIDEPNCCPICKHSIRPEKLYAIMYKDNENNNNLSITYMCNHCYKTFITKYSKCGSTFSPYYFQEVEYSTPDIFESKEFDSYISENFKEFVVIYNQALSAEHNKLDQISGLGYRKSLEFLIKDFLKKEYLDKEKDIEDWPLGKCINELVDNKELKIVASRATWLGNDQAHYIKKYNDKDINDLKKLINLSVHWISMIYITREAEMIEKMV